MQKLGSYNGVVCAALFLVITAFFIKSAPASWNDMSRVATIESLVERGTWAIDNSPWASQTMDKVLLGSHYYSEKVPMFAFLGTGVYAVLHNAFGGTLGADCNTLGKLCAYYWLTLILICLPAAIMLWLFHNFLVKQEASPWFAFIGTLALGFGTMIFPFSTVINNHVTAAASLFISFYLLTVINMNDRWRLALAGLFSMFAAVLDVNAAPIALGLWLIALARYRIVSVFLTMGTVVPLALALALNFQITGSVLPPNMIPNGFDFPGSPFPKTIGGFVPLDNLPDHAFRMTVGDEGLLAFNPLLVIALLCAFRVTTIRGHRMQIEAIFTLIGFTLLAISVLIFLHNFGGVAYGERHMIAGIPTLFAFNALVPRLSQVWRRAAWVGFLALSLLLLYSSQQGARLPWVYWRPPIYLTASSTPPFLGVDIAIHRTR